jgi:hypothetical protein
MYLKHGSSIVPDAIVTPSYYQMMRPKKVMVMMVSSPEANITNNILTMHKVQCQDCRRFLLRKSLSVHKVHPVEKMNLKIRSLEEKINGVGFNVDLQVKTNTKLGKVVDLFSRRTGLAMDRMEFSCEGRVLRLEDEVKDVQGETVWVSLVG